MAVFNPAKQIIGSFRGMKRFLIITSLLLTGCIGWFDNGLKEIIVDDYYLKAADVDVDCGLAYQIEPG